MKLNAFVTKQDISIQFFFFSADCLPVIDCDKFVFHFAELIVNIVFTRNLMFLYATLCPSGLAILLPVEMYTSRSPAAQDHHSTTRQDQQVVTWVPMRSMSSLQLSTSLQDLRSPCSPLSECFFTTYFSVYSNQNISLGVTEVRRKDPRFLIWPLSIASYGQLALYTLCLEALQVVQTTVHWLLALPLLSSLVAELWRMCSIKVC